MPLGRAVVSVAPISEFDGDSQCSPETDYRLAGGEAAGVTAGEYVSVWGVVGLSLMQPHGSSIEACPKNSGLSDFGISESGEAKTVQKTAIGR